MAAPTQPNMGTILRQELVRIPGERLPEDLEQISKIFEIRVPPYESPIKIRELCSRAIVKACKKGKPKNWAKIEQVKQYLCNFYNEKGESIIEVLRHEDSQAADRLVAMFVTVSGPMNVERHMHIYVGDEQSRRKLIEQGWILETSQTEERSNGIASSSALASPSTSKIPAVIISEHSAALTKAIPTKPLPPIPPLSPKQKSSQAERENFDKFTPKESELSPPSPISRSSSPGSSTSPTTLSTAHRERSSSLNTASISRAAGTSSPESGASSIHPALEIFKREGNTPAFRAALASQCLEVYALSYEQGIPELTEICRSSLQLPHDLLSDPYLSHLLPQFASKLWSLADKHGDPALKVICIRLYQCFPEHEASIPLSLRKLIPGRAEAEQWGMHFTLREGYAFIALTKLDFSIPNFTEICKITGIQSVCFAFSQPLGQQGLTVLQKFIHAFSSLFEKTLLSAVSTAKAHRRLYSTIIYSTQGEALSQVVTGVGTTVNVHSPFHPFIGSPKEKQTKDLHAPYTIDTFRANMDSALAHYATKIGEALIRCKDLQEFNLLVQWKCNMFKIWPYLTLIASLHSLKKIEIQCEEISASTNDDTNSWLSNVLSNLRNLESLTLINLQVKKFRGFTLNNKNLKKINFTSNQLDDRDIRLLLQDFRDLPSLESLNFNKNNIHEEGAEALVQFFSKHPRAIDISLENNPIDLNKFPNLLSKFEALRKRRR